MPLLPIAAADEPRKLILEGSRSVFINDKTFFVILKNGAAYPVEIVVDGKTVSKLTMSPPLAQPSISSVAMNIGNDHIFIGNTVGPSVLLKAAHVEEEKKIRTKMKIKMANISPLPQWSSMIRWN
jgi:cleavage and polyadenylation specificity factor subunit 1